MANFGAGMLTIGDSTLYLCGYDYDIEYKPTGLIAPPKVFEAPGKIYRKSRIRKKYVSFGPKIKCNKEIGFNITCKVKWFKGATKLFNGTIARTRRLPRRRITFKKQNFKFCGVRFKLRFRSRFNKWWENNKFSVRYGFKKGR